jgi:hypothetical protein
VLALAFWTLQDIVTEAEHLGDDASIRLLFNLASALLALYGMAHFRGGTPARTRHRAA